jgi:hypothetical protein
MWLAEKLDWKELKHTLVAPGLISLRPDDG